MKKRLFSAALALAMVLSLMPAALAAGEVAKASTQSVEVDGKAVTFQMYALADANGGLTNYVKLRDVAHVLNGTQAQFSVGYDGTISVTTGQPYADTGAEMSTPYSGDRAYRKGSGAVKVNGADAALDSIILTDDAGGDYTYFKLRDLGSALGFKVDWTAERGVIVETGGTAQPTTPAVGFTLESLQGIWYAEIEETWGLEWSIQGNQFTETYIIYDPDFGQQNYVTGTIVSVTESIEKSDIGDVLVINLELSNVTETTIEDGKITTENFATSDKVFITENGTLLAGVELPFTRIPAVKLYPEFQAALEAAQNKPSTPVVFDINPMDYSYTTIKYLYDHLKIPSSMNIISVYCTEHDRSGYSGEIISNTDQYYAVAVVYQAMNSLGAMKTNTFVSLYDLTTGSVKHDLKGYGDAIADNAWGARKTYGYQLANEALSIGNRAGLSSTLTREQIQSLVNQIKK